MTGFPRTTYVRLIVILLVLSWCLEVVGASYGVEIDRVLAVVGDQVLTRTELHEEMRVLLILRGGERAGTGHFSTELETTFLDYVLNQLVVSVHSLRAGFQEPSNLELDQVKQRLLNKFFSLESYQSFKRRFGLSESRIRNLLRRELKNELFLRDRLKARVRNGALPGKPQTQDELPLLKEILNEMRRTVSVRVIPNLSKPP